MAIRVILHSGILALANLGGIWLGFLAFYASSATNQVSVQIPVAGLVSVGAFVLWYRLIAPRRTSGLRIGNLREGILICVLALVWAAVVFVPIHYVVEGYLTAFSNVVGIWGFQLVVNAVAVAIATHVDRPGQDDRPIPRTR